MIRIERIYKAFGKQQILEDVTLDILPGTRLCILGGSGSGKSVLVKLILGLEELDEGEIYIDGQPIRSFSPSEWPGILSHFGVVFQGAALFDSLSVLRNVGIKFFEEREKSEEEIRQMVLTVLKSVQLDESILSKYPAELSGGMKKRVAIARAILHEPKYLIYDEPTTGLDPVSAAAIDELIEQLAAEPSRSSIIITHDMQTVERIASHIAMIHEKTLLFHGTKEDFFKSDRAEIRAFLKRA